MRRTRKVWAITFSENGWEYEGHMAITAFDVTRHIENPKAVWADGVLIEMDEDIGDVFISK